MRSLPGIVPLYTASEMRTVDRLAIDEVGIPEAILMERAGLGAAGEIIGLFPEASRIAVICGAGNNGGDGFVVARHLAETGRHVEVLLVEAESKIRRDSKVFLNILRKLDIPTERVNATGWRRRLAGYDLAIDAMLGTGVSGPPRPNIDVVIDAIEAVGLPVVALDIPTGVDASSGEIAGKSIRAVLTLTFHGPKVGLAIAPGRFAAGRVKVIDVGIPAKLEAGTSQALATAGVLGILPSRTRAGSKYQSGSVVAIGGAAGMSGAIALASRAAMRSGAGVVHGFTAEPIAQALDIQIPEVMFTGGVADENGMLSVAVVEKLEPMLDRATGVLIGPGMGLSDQTKAVARWVAKHAQRLVIDASGLAAFDGALDLLAQSATPDFLLTPHEGELARLLAADSAQVKAHRLASVREAAQRSACTVLLKGEDTIVCAPNGEFVICRGHTSQATAGTGDVLAGTAVGLLSRGVDAFGAAICAATGCGIAAASAAERFSVTGVMSGDLLDELPRALDPHSGLAIPQ